MIDEQLIERVTSQLYSSALRKVPEDTKQALRAAERHEVRMSSKATVRLMLESADAAEASGRFVCSDSGIPVYLLEIGSGARWTGDIKAAITRGFAQLVATIEPPLLKHVNNPLTNERGHAGKGIPAISVELISDADYIDITCAPKALGSGRWSAIETFISPTLAQIEAFVLEVVLKAGSQHCPPVVVGVGIGGTFEHAAKLAAHACYRPVGSLHHEHVIAQMEQRLTEAVNATGFGPMGTGGLTTALAVHVDYAFGHGFTPVAVCFNCWINRRAKARLFNDGRVQRLE